MSLENSENLEDLEDLEDLEYSNYFDSKNCKKCDDCHKCDNCKDCYVCKRCINCYNCTGCNYLYNCKNITFRECIIRYNDVYYKLMCKYYFENITNELNINNFNIEKYINSGVLVLYDDIKYDKYLNPRLYFCDTDCESCMTYLKEFKKEFKHEFNNLNFSKEYNFIKEIEPPNLSENNEIVEMYVQHHNNKCCLDNRITVDDVDNDDVDDEDNNNVICKVYLYNDVEYVTNPFYYKKIYSKFNKINEFEYEEYNKFSTNIYNYSIKNAIKIKILIPIKQFTNDVLN